MPRKHKIRLPVVNFTPEKPMEIRLNSRQGVFVTLLQDFFKGKEVTGYAVAKASDGRIPVTAVYECINSLVRLGILKERFEKLPKGTGRVRKRFVSLIPGRIVQLTK